MPRSHLSVFRDWNNIPAVHPFADPVEVENILGRQSAVSTSASALASQQSASALLLSLTDAFSDLYVIPASTSSSTSSTNAHNNNKPTTTAITSSAQDEDDEFFLQHQQKKQQQQQQVVTDASFGAFARSESYTQMLAANQQQGSKVFRRTSHISSLSNNNQNDAGINSNNKRPSFFNNAAMTISGSSRPGSVIQNNNSNKSFNMQQQVGSSLLSSDGSFAGEGTNSFVRVATMAMTTTSFNNTGALSNPSQQQQQQQQIDSINQKSGDSNHQSAINEDIDPAIPALHTHVLSLRQKLLVRPDEDTIQTLLQDIEINEDDDEVATLVKLMIAKRQNEKLRQSLEQFYDLHETFPFPALIAALAKEEDDIVKEAKASSRTMDNEEQVSAGGGLVGLLRSAVSQKKYRFQQDGFDLDLTYITPRIIAMGFPSSGAEAFYRNPMDQVEIFFKRRHGGHYRVYNLCSERQYDNDKLEGRWRRYPFDDHNAPCPIKLIPNFVSDATKLLREDPKNVVAVHCKAGKGRTGLMVACLLMALVPSLRDPNKALGYFASQRTDDAQGVTIASQIRYVHYFGQMLAKHHGEEPLPHRTLSLQKIVIWSPIRLAFPPLTQVDNIFFVVEENGEKKFDSLETATIRTFGTDDGFGGGVHYVFERSGKLPILRNITGDIRITVYLKTMLGKDELFHYWFNTTLCNPQFETMSKFELDKACKDHKNQVYCTDLMVQTFFIDAQIRKPLKYKPVVAPPLKKKKGIEGADQQQQQQSQGFSSSGMDNVGSENASASAGGSSQQSQQQISGDGGGALNNSKPGEKKEEKGFFSRLFGK